MQKIEVSDEFVQFVTDHAKAGLVKVDDLFAKELITVCTKTVLTPPNVMSYFGIKLVCEDYGSLTNTFGRVFYTPNKWVKVPGHGAFVSTSGGLCSASVNYPADRIIVLECREPLNEVGAMGMRLFRWVRTLLDTEIPAARKRFDPNLRARTSNHLQVADVTVDQFRYVFGDTDRERLPTSMWERESFRPTIIESKNGLFKCTTYYFTATNLVILCWDRLPLVWCEENSTFPPDEGWEQTPLKIKRYEARSDLGGMLRQDTITIPLHPSARASVPVVWCPPGDGHKYYKKLTATLQFLANEADDTLIRKD